MNTIARIAMATSLLFLVPVACDEAGQPLGTKNEAPTADAGRGGTFVDEDGDGHVTVALDGSGSVDPDGRIVSYAWTEGEAPLAMSVAPEVSLSVGTHVITLAVTDDGGSTGRDAIIVHVKPEPNMLPTVTILSPAPGETIAEGDPFLLSGAAVDPEDGALTGASLVWYIDGSRVGTGPTVEGTWAFAGREMRQVSLVATDSDAGWSRVVVTVRKQSAQSPVSFAADVLPFFTYYAECTRCHGREVAAGGVRLDSYEAITTGGNANGPLIVAGDVNQGTLVPQLLAQHHDYVWDLDIWFANQVLVPWIGAGAPNN